MTAEAYDFPSSSTLLQPHDNNKEPLWLFSNCYDQNATLSPISLSITLTVLQGVLARDRPRLESSCGSIDANMEHFQTVAPLDTSLYDQPLTMLAKFAGNVRGYILYDRHETDSLSVALNLVGAMAQPLVVVELHDETTVQNWTSWLRVADATHLQNNSLMQLLHVYPLGGSNHTNASLSNRILCPHDVFSKAPALLDWIVFGRCFTWTPDASHQNLTDQVLGDAHQFAVAFGWGNEGDLVGQLSNHSLSILASDWAHNLATLANVNTSGWMVRQSRPQDSVAMDTSTSAVQRRSMPPAQMHYICAVMTDGDNLQWLLNGFNQHHSGKWFNNSARGTVALGWTMTPALQRMAPTVLQRFYQMASPKDRFLAGPSGASYEFPNNDPDLDEFARRTALAMKEADLKVLNIICSPQLLEGDMDRVAGAFLEHDQIQGLFFYTWDDRYNEWGAFIKWKFGKPIVSGRVALWNDTTPEDIASLIRQLPTDPTRPDAYSLIPVHAWTYDVSDVAHMKDLLANHTVEFVDPETFIDLIQNNVIMMEAIRL